VKLRVGANLTARLDQNRLVACLATPGRAGDAVLTDRARGRLATLRVAVEGDEPTEKRTPRSAINHGQSLLWLRATGRLRAMPSTAAVAKALDRRLAWTGPVYRLPGMRGLDAYFTVRRDVLLLRARSGDERGLARAVKALGLREDREKSRYLGGWRCFQHDEYDAPGRPDAIALRARLERDPAVEAELDYVPLLSPFQFVPGDPLYAGAWNLQRVGSEPAWDLTRGDRRVVIAVIDSGCDLAHEDLRGAYVSPGVNVGDMTLDGSPTINARFGVAEGHGTWVVGVIAPAIDNTIGIAGLAAGCGILPIAVPSGSTVELAAAVRYAAMHGAHVINMSMAIGSFWFETSTRAAVDDALAAGCVICASAGNDDVATLVYPAHYPPVMAIGGSLRDDRRWVSAPWGSNYGDELYDGRPTGVSVVAPAEDIETTDITGPAGFTPAPSPAGDYVYRGATFPSFFGATSGACPHAAAAAGLVRSLYPALTNVDVRRVIERTAEKVGGYTYADAAGYPNGSRHPEMGYGRLNVHRALDLGDVMIRDWPGDAGIEPSTPPGGNFWSTSDIIIRPADDGVFRPDDPSLSGVLTRGATHTVSVRVRNAGPATARGIDVRLCAIPYAGLEFRYPTDWTADDALHVRPSLVDTLPFDLPAGDTRVVRFRFTSAQIESIAGWTDMAWHPCLLGMVTAANDYAFAGAPAGLSLQTRRNNLAQRNLTVSPLRMMSMPIVIGHPENPDDLVELVIEAGELVKRGQVHLMLGNARAALPAADRAQAFVKGDVKLGRVTGGRAKRIGNERAVVLEAPRAIVELRLPRPGRYPLRLRVNPPHGAHANEPFVVHASQRSPAHGVTGGATLALVGGQ
jgi:subtilisin family serine protease